MGVEREDARAGVGAAAESAGDRAPAQATRSDELPPERPTPTPVAGLAPAPPAQSVGFTLSSLGFAVSSRFVQTLAPLGIEPREFALLRTVHAAEGQTQQA